MPVDGLDDAVEVLLELPRQSALADPRLADDRDEPRTAVPAGRVKEFAEQPQLVLAAHEGRFEAVRDAVPAALTDHAKGTVCRHRCSLAAEHLLTGFLEGDRA